MCSTVYPVTGSYRMRIYKTVDSKFPEETKPLRHMSCLPATPTPPTHTHSTWLLSDLYQNLPRPTESDKLKASFRFLSLSLSVFRLCHTCYLSFPLYYQLLTLFTRSFRPCSVAPFFFLLSDVVPLRFARS